MLSQVRQIQSQNACANYFIGDTLEPTQKESSGLFFLKQKNMFLKKQNNLSPKKNLTKEKTTTKPHKKKLTNPRQKSATLHLKILTLENKTLPLRTHVVFSYLMKS